MLKQTKMCIIRKETSYSVTYHQVTQPYLVSVYVEGTVQFMDHIPDITHTAFSVSGETSWRKRGIYNNTLPHTTNGTGQEGNQSEQYM